MKTKLTAMIVTAFTLLVMHDARAIGTGFTYQGRLTDSGSLPNNVYDMSIILCSTASPPGGQVGSAVLLDNVPVTNGLFTVILNAAGQFGASAFDGSDRWLEISVRPGTDTGAYTKLLPRQSVTPTPYAITASNLTPGTGLAGTYSGSLTLNNAANSFTGNGSGLSSLNAANLSSGTVPDGRLSANVALLNRNPQTFTGQNIFNGNVGIGTTGPSQKLDVNGGIRATGGSTASSGVGVEIAYGDLGNVGRIFAYDRSGSTFEDFGIGNFSQGKGIFVQATTGNVGIGITSPDTKLEVNGDVHIYGGSTLYFEGGPSDPNYFLAPFVLFDAAGMRLSGFRGVRLATGQGDILNVADDKVGIGTTNPSEKLHVAGNYLRVNGAAGQAACIGNHTANNDVVFGSLNPSIQEISFFNPTTGFMNATMNNMTAFGTASVCVLTITGGCDLAEPFEMSSKEIPKGAVVIIDEESPGKLKLSERAYDTRVAGILSGANGVNSGILLKQEGFNDGGENVALSGRVYALADASFGLIKPGDLLTTSATPGHCMKVTNHARAQGAIIGKAMTPLKEGKGMVLVLVTLQ